MTGMVSSLNTNQLLSTDRVFKLGVIDGQKPKNTLGLTDPRLFTGENELHAIQDEQTCLWSLKYTAGVIPPPLRQQFTSFKMCKKFVEDYFRGRNVEIKEVIA